MSDIDGSLRAGDLLADEQKEWLNTKDLSAPDVMFFENSPCNKVSPKARIAKNNCTSTNAPGVAVMGPSAAYATNSRPVDIVNQGRIGAAQGKMRGFICLHRDAVRMKGGIDWMRRNGIPVCGLTVASDCREGSDRWDGAMC